MAHLPEMRVTKATIGQSWASAVDVEVWQKPPPVAAGMVAVVDQEEFLAGPSCSRNLKGRVSRSAAATVVAAITRAHAPSGMPPSSAAAPPPP